MTEAEHNEITTWIKIQKINGGKFPTHKQILLKMLRVAKEVTYIDGLEYGLGSTFRSRMSELAKDYPIISCHKQVPTRYDTTARIKAHRLQQTDLNETA